MTCSIRQASSAATSGLTPMRTSQVESSVCRSYILSAISRPLSKRVMKPSLSTSIYPLVLRFFMATLTLGLEKPNSFAMSMERTFPWRLCMMSIASR